MSAPILAVDLGTTNVKAVLVAADGAVLARHAVRCAASHGARSLQDPAQVLAAASGAVRAIAGVAHPAALVLSTAMHGVVPLDGELRPRGPLSTWADPVGGERVLALRTTTIGRALHERTGTPLHTSSWLARVPALAERADAGIAGAARLGSAKTLLLAAWCGVDAVDASLASATGLFDARRGTWDPEALALAGVTAEQLGPVVLTTHVVTSWRPGIARSLGLAAELPLVVGASDGVLAHLGVGGDDPSVTSVTLGTSGAARRLGGRAAPVADQGLFRYVLDAERCVVGGAVSNVGRALEWAAALLRPELAIDDAVAALLAEAATIAPDAHGVPRFEPRLAAERFPDYDLDDAPRGAFTALGYETDRAHLARAVVEGLVAPVARIVAALDTALGTARRAGGAIRCGGGLAESPVVRTALARATHRTLEVAASAESAAIGAARLARQALGLGDAFRFEAR